MNRLFASGGQSIGASASASVLPMNIQDLFPLRWTGWISLQSKGLSRVFSNTTVQKYQDTSHSHSKRVKVERKRPVYSVSYTLQTTLGFKPTNTLGDSASLSGLWTPPFNFHLFFSRKGSTVLSACFLSV